MAIRIERRKFLATFGAAAAAAWPVTARAQQPANTARIGVLATLPLAYVAATDAKR